MALAPILFASRNAFATDVDPRIAASWPGYFRGSVYSLAVEGDFAYLPLNRRGMMVLDVSDPSNPQRVGGIADFSSVVSIAVNGPIAYMAEDYRGLQVLDISNPSNPQVAAVVPGSGKRVEIHNDHLALASASGFELFSLADPRAPARLGAVSFSNNEDWTVPGVAFAGTLAFVANGPEGLVIIDCSNPTQLRIVGGFETDGSARDVAIANNRAYLADQSGGLKILDVSDPAALRSIGFFPGDFFQVALRADVAIVGGDDGLKSVDVSNPSEPRLLREIPDALGVTELLFRGDYLYAVTGSGGLEIFDCTNPSAPVRIGDSHTAGSASALDIAGGYAYVADGRAGVQVIDITNPDRGMHWAGRWRATDYCVDIKIQNGHAFIANYQRGLTVLSLRDPIRPELVANVPFGNAVRINISDTHAFVRESIGGNQGRLRIFDIRNPTAPLEFNPPWIADYSDVAAISGRHIYLRKSSGTLGVMDTAPDGGLSLIAGLPFPGRVVAHQNFLYVQEQGGVAVYNVENPSAPQRVAFNNSIFLGDLLSQDGDKIFNSAFIDQTSIDLSNPAQPRSNGGINTGPMEIGALKARNGFLFAAAADEGLVAFDFRTPANPQQATSMAIANGRMIGEIRSHLLVGDWTKLTGYNLENPLAPTKSSELTLSSLWDFAANDRFVFTAAGDDGIRIYDYADVAAPRLVGVFPGSFYDDIFVAGNRLFTTASGWLRILDITEINAPTELGRYHLNTASSKFTASGDLALVSADVRGLLIFDVSKPSLPRELSRYIEPLPYPYSVHWPEFAAPAWMEMNGRYAYLAYDSPARSARLVTLDLSDPTNPVAASTLPLPGRFTAVKRDGARLYLSSAASGVHILDLSDPAHPVRLGGNSSFYALGCAVIGDHIYGVSEKELVILNQYSHLPNGPIYFADAAQADGSIEMRVSGLTDIDVQVETSDDLINWLPWETFELPVGGKVLSRPLIGSRFFRARSR